MYLYIPKKSKEIYKEIIAHRGYHDIWPENSILAFPLYLKLSPFI